MLLLPSVLVPESIMMAVVAVVAVVVAAVTVAALEMMTAHSKTHASGLDTYLRTGPTNASPAHILNGLSVWGVNGRQKSNRTCPGPTSCPVLCKAGYKMVEASSDAAVKLLGRFLAADLCVVNIPVRCN